MEESTLVSSLREEVAAIKATLEEAKATGQTFNEAQTEFIIIDPILRRLGYGPLEIAKRGHDSIANNFPDYTLLNGKSQKWFLEAKRLDLNLQDGEAAQAVNYANNQGSEWAVLTNGRKWYIYNAHLPKPLPEKRIIQINDLFADDTAIHQLSLLSKESMLRGELGNVWLRQQVHTVMQHQLTTPHSELRKLLKRLSHDVTKAVITDTLIAEVLSSSFSDKVFPSMRIAADFTSNDRVDIKPTAPALLLDQILPSADTQFTFEEIARNPVIAVKRRPSELCFRDGEVVKVSTWADAAMTVLTKIGMAYSLPRLPFSGGRQGKNYFLNTSPNHSNGKQMLSFRKAIVGEEVVFIDTNRSVGDISGCLVAFFQAIGTPMDTVKVLIKPSKV